MQAGQLKPGEQVVTLSGATETVAWVQVVAGQPDMYNLTVASDHTYAVGAGHAVVHNVCKPTLSPDGSGGGSTATNTVDLYRAVGVREYNSIIDTGQFLPGGNSLEARQFALTEEEAIAYARTDLSKVAIFKATIQRDALASFDFSRSIDPTIFKNGVVTVQPEWQTQVFQASLISIVQVLLITSGGMPCSLRTSCSSGLIEVDVALLLSPAIIHRSMLGANTPPARLRA